MIIQDVINLLEEFAPLAYAEDFDNVGLLVGDKNTKLSGVLVTLDTLESVVDEAIENKYNLIVSFHPIIFKGLKKITGKTYVERVILKAIKHDIAIYAIHTALDNAFQGVNDAICNQLELVNKQILIPQPQTIKKLTTFVSKDEAEILRTALFNAGAGSIGNYSNCSFNTEGIGTFMGNEESSPTKGIKGKTHKEEETQISRRRMKRLNKNTLVGKLVTDAFELPNDEDSNIGALVRFRRDIIEANPETYGTLAIDDIYEVFPIPSASLAANPNLTQNSGY